MALDKATLVTDLKAILKQPNVNDNVDEIASELVVAFEKFVKTGKATGTDSRGDAHNLTIV